jgi:hypothetical protein
LLMHGRHFRPGVKDMRDVVAGQAVEVFRFPFPRPTEK